MKLVFDAVCFSYQAGAPLLSDVSFAVAPGQTCCLLGPNGAGKTTLVRCAVGLAHPSAGTVRVGSVRVGDVSAHTLARHVAYVPQSVEAIFPVSCLDIVLAGRTPYVRFGGMPTEADRHVALSSLGLLGLAHLAERPFGEVSGGERQLVTIARALCQQAPVIVLDEPTSALDFGNQVRVMSIVKEMASSGKTVLMTSHAPNQALDGADLVVLLRQGSVMSAGKPDDVITGEALSDLYGVDVSVVEVPGSPEPRKVCLPVRPIGAKPGEPTGLSSLKKG
jgi:iron complex transport system ATP-binding protein